MVQAYRQTFDSVEMCEPTNYSYVMLFGVDDEAWRDWEVKYSVIMIITNDKMSGMAEMKADLVVLSRYINWRSSCSTRRQGTGTSGSCSSSSSRLGCSA